VGKNRKLVGKAKTLFSTHRGKKLSLRNTFSSLTQINTLRMLQEKMKLAKMLKSTFPHLMAKSWCFTTKPSLKGEGSLSLKTNKEKIKGKEETIDCLLLYFLQRPIEWCNHSRASFRTTQRKNSWNQGSFQLFIVRNRRKR